MPFLFQKQTAWRQATYKKDKRSASGVRDLEPVSPVRDERICEGGKACPREGAHIKELKGTDSSQNEIENTPRIVDVSL